MSVPRWWTPTVRHEYADGPRSCCGLCGRRWGNPIHRQQRHSPADTTMRPRCAECGREGYFYGLTSDFRIAGHLDQRIKHSFKEPTDD